MEVLDWGQCTHQVVYSVAKERERRFWRTMQNLHVSPRHKRSV